MWIACAAKTVSDADCGREVKGGVLRYTKGSNDANVYAALAQLMRTGDFRRSFAEGPPKSCLSGPILEDATYRKCSAARVQRWHGVERSRSGRGRRAFRRLALQGLPGARYRAARATEGEITASSSGTVTLTIGFGRPHPVTPVAA